MSQHYTAISIFDLDHTLITRNSSLDFGYFLFDRKVINFKTLLRLTFYYFRHKILGLPAAELHRQAVRNFLGTRKPEELYEWSRLYFEKKGRFCTHAPTANCLQKAKVDGHYTAILSNAPDFIVRPFAQFFGVDEWHGSKYPTGDRLKNNAVHTLDGGEKALLAMKIASGLGLELESITAYSDSILDLPLLEIAGNPVAVNPDRPLKRLCTVKQWKILY